MRERIIGIDVARAFAFFGMVLVNFKVAMGTATEGPIWLVRLAGLLDGRAAATFVVLAGVGISLFSRTARLTLDHELIWKVRRDLFRRAIFLFVLGALLSLVWPADILHFYGLYLFIAAIFVNARSRSVLLIASGLICASYMMLFWLDYEAGWNWETLENEDMWRWPSGLRNLFVNGFHPVFPWAAFVLVGMVVGRFDLTSKKVRRRILALGGFLVLVGEGLSFGLSRLLASWLEPKDWGEMQAVVDTSPMPPTPFYMLAGAGVAMIMVALCSGVQLRGRNRWLIQALAHTGQLALTLYLAHVFLGLGVLEALGRLEGKTLAWSVESGAYFCLASVVFSTLWRRQFAHGPIEWLMRIFCTKKA